MKTLANDLKTNNLHKLYVFWGIEELLKRHYLNRVTELFDGIGADLNISVFEGKSATAEAMSGAWATLPVFADKRLVVAKDTGLFASGKGSASESEKLAAVITEIPESSVVVFVEEQIDKRLKLYKRAEETGHIVEFKPLAGKELAGWLIKLIAKRGKTIDFDNAALMIKNIGVPESGSLMETLLTEAEKLCDYAEGNAINSDDIECICSKSLETRIFDMMDSIGNKNLMKSLEIYYNLLMLKEQPVVVLSLMARQFRLILQSKLMAEKGENAQSAAAALGQKSFVVVNCLRQARNFSVDVLKSALVDCVEADIGIKSGKLDGVTGVEMLILKYARA